MAIDDLTLRQQTTPQLYDEAIVLKRRAVSIRQAQTATLRLHIRDDSGKNLNLEDYGFPPTQSSSMASLGDTGAAPYIKCRFSEVSAISTDYTDSDGFLVDSVSGLVQAVIPLEVSAAAGVYLAEFGLFNPADELVYVNDCYIWCDPSAWVRGSSNTTIPQPAIPSLDAIRQSVRDSDPAENLLTDDYGYPLADICYAAARTVDFWNDQPPPLTAFRYTTQTFPFRDIWMKGIQMFLFQQAEEWYRRNKLRYNAGGTQVDDLHRDREYKAAWSERMAEFQQLVTQRKVAINIAQGSGTLGSPYGLRTGIGFNYNY